MLSLREKRRTAKQRAAVGSPGMLKYDPTRTGMLRRAMVAELRRRFDRFAKAVKRSVSAEDDFGLAVNVYCPTGEGGGVDPTCGSGGSVLVGAGAVAMHLERAIKDKIDLGLAKLPSPIRIALATAYVVAFSAWTASQSLAERVAKEKNLTDEQAHQLRGVLAAADVAVFKPAAMLSAALGAPGVVQALGWAIPPATGAYLLYSAAYNPVATATAAYKAVRDVAKYVKSRLHGEGPLSTTNVDDVWRLMDAIERHGYDDVYFATLCATDLDVRLVDRVYATLNRFCPTGPGGGVDPTCGKLDVHMVMGAATQLDVVFKGRLTAQQVAEACGASLGATVRIEAVRNGLKVTIDHPDYEMQRTVLKDRIVNDYFGVKGETGRGVGTELFARQVDKAVEHGFTSFETQAVRDDEIGLNGYYTWPRLGYDTEIGDHKLSDMMRTKEGREEWRKEGDTIYLSFDLREGSLSRRILDAYRAAKASKRGTANVKRGGRSDARRGMGVNRREFAFVEDAAKLAAFRARLREELRAAGLTDVALWRKYIDAGYRRGAGRSYDDTVKRVRAAEPTKAPEFYEGGKEMFLKSSFARPVAREKVEHLAARAYDELANVTADMSNRMARTLSDSMIEGTSPREAAAALVADVGFSRVRATTIARTEVIRAHAEGQLDALEQLGVEELGVDVEWSATGDDRVCPICEAFDGETYSMEEARGMLPAHPNCRCAWVPHVEAPSDSDAG